MTFSAAALALFASASATALAGGTIDLLDAGGAVVASAGTGTPTASGAVTTMGGFPKTVTAAASGTVASARYRTSGGDNHKSAMTVGLAGSGAQVILSALSITAGQTVQITSATLTHSAA
jgi:hypothetical protein